MLIRALLTAAVVLCSAWPQPADLILRNGKIATLEAATEICADEELESWDVLDLLTSLVDKSLVVAELQGTSPRYRLLESTREYAREKLEEGVQYQLIARRHAERWHVPLQDQSEMNR